MLRCIFFIELQEGSDDDFPYKSLQFSKPVRMVLMKFFILRFAIYAYGETKFILEVTRTFPHFSKAMNRFKLTAMFLLTMSFTRGNICPARPLSVKNRTLNHFWVFWLLEFFQRIFWFSSFYSR